MSDQEMIELAAKAISLPECGWMHKTFTYVKDNKFTTWDPLHDDGDALRLATKLRISLIHEQEYMGGPVLETLEATSPPEPGTEHRHVSTECLNEIGADEFAATRRAIVRAAAAIGEAMP